MPRNTPRLQRKARAHARVTYARVRARRNGHRRARSRPASAYLDHVLGTELTIVQEGGCQMMGPNCPTYELDRDGTFRLFRTGEDEYLMALVTGPDQISWKALRTYLNQSRLTMANEAEVLAVTGYPVGAVSPFGTKRTMRILVDPGVFVEDEISIGSGVRGTTIILKSADLRRAMGDSVVVPLFENPA